MDVVNFKMGECCVVSKFICLCVMVGIGYFFWFFNILCEFNVDLVYC